MSRRLAFARGRGPARLLALGAMLLPLAMAGCAGPVDLPPAATAAADPPTPRFLGWGQVDCAAISWSVPVLASSLEPYLPEGFEPAEPATGSRLVAGQAAMLGFRAVECAQGFGQQEVLRSVQSGYLYTAVLPPAELREERFGPRYAYAWDLLVAADDWRADAGAWGMALHDGGALVGPTAQGWAGALAMDRVGSFRLEGRALDAGQPATDRECRTITLGAEGFALWDAMNEDLVIANGVGAWSVNPESWVATVLGATQGLATFELATFSMPAATVHWPGDAVGPVDQPRA